MQVLNFKRARLTRIPEIFENDNPVSDTLG